MPITARHTLVCSVLFLDIEGYSKRPVAEQLALKERFNALLLAALDPVATESRVLLDTGDGAAVGFLGAPEDALFAALHVSEGCSSQTPALSIRMGINLGPVRLLKDINGRTNIIGDGINDAQRVMSFAAPGSILASRAYFEVVSRIASDYATLFSFQGVRTDKHVREHAVYAIGTQAPAAAETVATARTGTMARPRLVLVAALLLAGIALIVLNQPGSADDIAEPIAAVPTPVITDPPPNASPAKPFDADVFQPERRPPDSAATDAPSPDWLTAMREELTACDAKGFLQRAVCAEQVRWKFCAPAHWNEVAECVVEHGNKTPG